MLSSMSVPPQADAALRILGLRVAAPSGEACVEIPWDRTPFELEPLLTASLALGDGRLVRAFAPAGEGEAVDLLDVPLGEALRSGANPAGAEAVVVEVEPEDGSAPVRFTVSCEQLGEPEAHRAYPRGVDDHGRRLADALHAAEEPEWFCDGASSLSCCEATRSAPEQHAWVTLD